MSRFPIILLLPLALHAAAGAARAQAAVLTLEEVYALARERNPMLHAAHAAADAVAAQQPGATRPPDPQLQVGVMNASLPGLRADMAASMAPAVQAMQMVPFPGKLRLSGELARQGTGIARATADEAWWEVRTRAALAYYEIYRIDREVETMQETLDWLRAFEQAATAMYAAGGGRQSDVLRAGVEIARMQADLARMRAMRSMAAARLNAVIDRSHDAPLGAVALPPLPRARPPVAALVARADSERARLASGRLAVEQARTREALARREIWPDLTLGVQYGQRPDGPGTERMGSVMLGFSVPVHARARQLQMRREAAAMTDMAHAELAATRAEVAARIAELDAELHRAQTLADLYRTEVLPQAEATVASAFGAYRVGRVDFMTLLDAQMTLNRYQRESYALLAEYGAALAELEMTIGDVLDAGTDTLEEPR